MLPDLRYKGLIIMWTILACSLNLGLRRELTAYINSVPGEHSPHPVGQHTLTLYIKCVAPMGQPSNVESKKCQEHFPGLSIATLFLHCQGSKSRHPRGNWAEFPPGPPRTKCYNLNSEIACIFLQPNSHNTHQKQRARFVLER